MAPCFLYRLPPDPFDETGDIGVCEQPRGAEITLGQFPFRKQRVKFFVADAVHVRPFTAAL